MLYYNNTIMSRTCLIIEYANMVFLYGFCNGNANAACCEYATQFPHRRLPSKSVFSLTFQRLRETDFLNMVSRTDGIFAPLQNKRRIDIILQYFNQNPSTSIRRCSAELGISRKVIWKTLAANKRHSYHCQPVQHLLPADMSHRRAFCDWFLSRTNKDPQFLQNILWTDEAIFTKKTVLDQRNGHVWLHENPGTICKQDIQHDFQCNVWLGIIGNTLIGPHFLPLRLNANEFLKFLDNEFYDLLENIPLNTRVNSWFQMDDCPAHDGRGPQEWLNIHFPRRWIGRTGPVAWPLHSPDLSPLHFFIWGALKKKVYEVPVDDLYSLKQRIVQACQEITDTQCQSVTDTFIDRCNACLQAGGNYLE